MQSFIESNDSEGLSLYIHLPYCESLCTFCGCRKHITKNHGVEEPYVQTLLKEWDLYCDLFPETPKIKKLHLGGGTPTFFSLKTLDALIEGLFKRASRAEHFEFSYEGHPNYTSREQIEGLYDLGFRRNSFGVQDYDPKVQKAIHRIQSFENVSKVTKWSRDIGYESVGHDIVFGLPLQTKESVRDTLEKTKELAPDRIAFYSYAHVPWIKGTGQRGFDEADLPQGEQKRELYEMGTDTFGKLGYVEIGMDHFALKSDSLYRATQDQTLHRNFMGYTAGKTQLMIGLGMSSISDSWYAFAQNHKKVSTYQDAVNAGDFPIFRGHDLTDEDLIIRKHILRIMCESKTDWILPESRFPELDAVLKDLLELESDGALVIGEDGLRIPDLGRPFLRNICMAFDLRLKRKTTNTRIFSSTV